MGVVTPNGRLTGESLPTQEARTRDISRIASSRPGATSSTRISTPIRMTIARSTIWSTGIRGRPQIHLVVRGLPPHALQADIMARRSECGADGGRGGELHGPAVRRVPGCRGGLRGEQTRLGGGGGGTANGGGGCERHRRRAADHGSPSSKRYASTARSRAGVVGARLPFLGLAGAPHSARYQPIRSAILMVSAAFALVACQSKAASDMRARRTEIPPPSPAL